METFLLRYQQAVELGFRSETETVTKSREEQDQRTALIFATETATGARENDITEPGDYHSLKTDDFIPPFQERTRKVQTSTQGVDTKTAAQEEFEQRLSSFSATETITETREQTDYSVPMFPAVFKSI
jgi:hypothetical protein